MNRQSVSAPKQRPSQQDEPEPIRAPCSAKPRTHEPSYSLLDLPVEMFVMAGAFLSLREMANLCLVHRTFSSLGPELLSELGSLDFSRIFVPQQRDPDQTEEETLCKFLAAQPLPNVTYLELGSRVVSPELCDFLKSSCPNIGRVKMQLNWLMQAGDVRNFLSAFVLKHLFLDFQQISAQSQQASLWSEVVQALLPTDAIGEPSSK